MDDERYSDNFIVSVNRILVLFRHFLHFIRDRTNLLASVFVHAYLKPKRKLNIRR